METRQLTISLLIIIGLGAAALLVQAIVSPRYPGMPYSPSTSGGVCTMEAKMCSDGSYVSRHGPNCEFALCPNTMASSSKVVSAKIGVKTGDTAIAITPLKILEDSRCPIDVQCIQKGTVRLNAEITTNNSTTQQAFNLGVPIAFATRIVTLIGVTPQADTRTSRDPSTYVFTFEIKTK